LYIQPVTDSLYNDDVVKAEAERLRQQREMQQEEEFSQLKLAEEELVQVSIWLSLLPCLILCTLTSVAWLLCSLCVLYVVKTQFDCTLFFWSLVTAQVFLRFDIL